MTDKEIRNEALKVLERLPQEFRARLENVEIVVEKEAGRKRLRDLGLDPKRDVLYGLYEGVPLPERSVLNPPLLPDKITLFAGTLNCDFRDPDELRKEIRLTLVHEIAHYFGLDEEEIEKLGY